MKKKHEIKNEKAAQLRRYNVDVQFVLGLNFIFICFKIIVIHFHTFPYSPKTKENIIYTKDKIEPHKMYGNVSCEFEAKEFKI